MAQVRGETAGPPANLFALGSVLYEMVGGLPAVRAATAAETLTAVLTALAPVAGVPLGEHPRSPTAGVSFQAQTLLRGDVPSARFAADGDSLPFTAQSSGSDRALWPFRPGHPAKLPLAAPSSLPLLDLSANGRLLLSREEFRAEIGGRLSFFGRQGGRGRQVLVLTRNGEHDLYRVRRTWSVLYTADGLRQPSDENGETTLLGGPSCRQAAEPGRSGPTAGAVARETGRYSALKLCSSTGIVVSSQTSSM